jgi:hypothetical protein
MHTHSDVRFVDLTDAMLTEKGNDRDGDCAYYPLGSHWAWRGAWAGWNTVVASLTAALPALRPIPRTACARTEVSEAGTDSMADHTYIGDLLHQRGYQFLPIASHVTFVRNEHGEILSASQPDGTLPSTLVVHDSFGTWILPFVAESSSRMTASWEHGFPKDLVQTARPDVVVQVYTERLLVWGLPRLMPDADLVDAATFAGYPVLWGPLDLAADPLPAGEGGMRVAHGDGGLRLDVTGGNSVLNLPPVEVPAGAELALRVDITAPAPTSLTIFFQLSDDRRFARVHAANVALAAGRNDVRFRVRTSDLWGPLKLHLGADGAYVLHAIEARSAVP